MLSIFSCAYWPNVCLLIGLFVFLLLSCMSCLYILGIKPLSVTLFAKVFSQSVGCLFVYGFLCCAKAYKFDWVPFVYFVGVFLIQFLALVVIGGFVFWFSCSLLSFFLNYLKIFFNNYFLF